MSLFAATVPRELYDGLQARYDALLEKYHALRMQGAVVPTPGKVLPPPPDVDRRAERRMVDGIAGEIANHLKSIPGVSAEAAEAEAARIRREAFAPFGDPPLS